MSTINCNIDNILSQLSWKCPQSKQEEGISLARNVYCLKAFFQPIGINFGKDIWENCARIISERSDEELEPYIRDMLLWLEDLNWPGAECILDRLIRFEKVDVLARNIDTWVPALQKLEEWAWLSFLAELLKNRNLVDILEPEVLRALQNYRN